MPSTLHTLRITPNAILLLLLLCLPLLLQATEGEWIKDSKTGCDVWCPRPANFSKNTATWSGGCVAGTVTGKGILQWYWDGKPEGHYEGELKDGKQHGYGVDTLADGSRYEGQFKDGKRHGHGVFTYYFGAHYDGEFKDDKFNGYGVFTYPDGTSRKGVWKDGQEVE